MSDSSNLSAGNERIAARLRLIAPEGRWQVFGENAGTTDGLDAFCVIARSRPPDASGFELRLEKPHRVPEKLGDVMARILRERGWTAWFGALCRPHSMVGARVCYTALPGVREYFYQRAGYHESSSLWSDRVRNWICSVLGLGHLPLVGATAASFVTCVLALGLMVFAPPDAWKFCLLALAVVASVLCASLEKWAHRHYFAEDPREVVLDEVAGMALALAITGPGIWTILAAFFAFRFFDIFKPGIHWVERRRWRGTIVWDDLLAGIYAGASVRLLAMVVGAIGEHL